MLSSSETKIPIPEPGKRNIMITSALPYVNNYPHLGNIIGAVLSADVFSRYCKQRGYNTIYICGTDEYGTATETKAYQEGLTPQEICTKYYKLHKEVYEWFDIAFDYFGRTSTEQQTKIAQDIFLKLYRNGYLSEKTIQQLYDEQSGKFLADRFVKGTCPSCGYEDARGDQCDKCGKLLNPTELINPRSVISNSEPVLKETDHIFIKLQELQSKTKDWFENNKDTSLWTTVARTITESWFEKGLEERCITRDLKWGTPVPLEKFIDKVFYVWFDAPIGYISITAAFFNSLGDESAWEKWWKDPSNVKYYQFMGKDNVPFHSVIFPSSLLGTGENWKLVDVLSSTEYLNYEHLKFSKTNGTGVFGDQAKDTGIPSEVWRYYLIAMRPEHSDTRFEWSELQTKNNNELLANLGNFTNRVLKFVQNTFNSTVPAKEGEYTEEDKHVISSINTKIKEYIESLENVRLKEGLQTTMLISKIGNQYLQDQKPWELAKKDTSRCATVVNLGVQIVATLSALLEPFIPGFCRKLNEQLNYTGTNSILDELDLNRVPAGHVIGEPTGLFKKIEDTEVKEWKKRFGGGEEEIFQLDLRVGQIETVEEHPKADKLYVFTVKIADNIKRNIVGGLREAYPDPQSLIGKKVVVACNLVVAKLKDVESEGMLLASKQDGGLVSLVIPSVDVPLGSQVYPKGTAFKPEKVLKKGPLKNILEVLKVGKNNVPYYKDNFPLSIFDAEKKQIGGVVTERDIKEGSGIF
ncbi:hypothetical protein FDP41_000217 [Naegleria fowleri]|uniref:methionine--tRNA ligase n=1 Tax=Naegleria fowleri TaxID=5763 RepID=A0A6A5CIZ0_NAEFO|nr:uncharacterized protein FDP41_000217 [Naegleria fowleri]KAF0985178.1 hypothetical protein FDP41_000217 [Naegleria fowleri]